MIKLYDGGAFLLNGSRIVAEADADAEQLRSQGKDGVTAVEANPLADHILLKVCSKIMDDVTTTDELIPSGETASYRSNPLGLAEFALSRRDPAYVGRSKKASALESARVGGQSVTVISPELSAAYQAIGQMPEFETIDPQQTEM